MDTFSTNETEYMRRALEIARNGEGRVSPNPPVGCVLVRDGHILAEGWHDRYGDLHAEAMALSQLPPGGAKGAVAYVTLSPCASQGKQPPCADALAKAEVAEVVAATVDPNPQNASGLERLKELGVPTRSGLLREEAEYLARGFFSRQIAGRPYVTLKYAMTLDGKIATATGDSRWISSEASREIVQDMRSRYDAVMVGIGTVAADNPLLNVREPVWSIRGGDDKHRQPVRVIVDTHCRMSAKALMLDKEKNPGGQVIIATLEGENNPRAAKLAQAGALILKVPGLDGRVCLKELMKQLSATGVNMILCEGGGCLAAGLLKESMLDDVVAFVAPKIVGGKGSLGPVGELGIYAMADARTLEICEWTTVATDIMIRAKVVSAAKE